MKKLLSVASFILAVGILGLFLNLLSDLYRATSKSGQDGALLTGEALSNYWKWKEFQQTNIHAFTMTVASVNAEELREFKGWMKRTNHWSMDGSTTKPPITITNETKAVVPLVFNNGLDDWLGNTNSPFGQFLARANRIVKLDGGRFQAQFSDPEKPDSGWMPLYDGGVTYKTLADCQWHLRLSWETQKTTQDTLMKFLPGVAYNIIDELYAPMTKALKEMSASLRADTELLRQQNSEMFGAPIKPTNSPKAAVTMVTNAYYEAFLLTSNSTLNSAVIQVDSIAGTKSTELEINAPGETWLIFERDWTSALSRFQPIVTGPSNGWWHIEFRKP